MQSLVQMLYSSLGQPTQGIGFYLSSSGRMNLYIKCSTTYETVAKIQDIQVVNIWHSDRV